MGTHQSTPCCGEDLRGRIRELEDQLIDVHHASELQFKVAQYNILAGYLGQNTQPWFLYPIPKLDEPRGLSANGEPTESRRAEILNKFYARDPDGKLLNKGWPRFVEGLLSPEEIAAVERLDADIFTWDKRKHKLVSTCLELECDVLSLVELDSFDYFSTTLGGHGFDGRFKKRPRESTADGCGIFWRKSKFSLHASCDIEFVDHDPKSGKEVKDRCALVTILKSTEKKNTFVVVVSCHLARNPEEKTKDEIRAHQVASLFNQLTNFVGLEAAKYESPGETKDVSSPSRGAYQPLGVSHRTVPSQAFYILARV